MNKRILPIGTQNFEIIRKENFVYVDKTNLIYELATEGRMYFLSRPRRFGKSLLVSTLEAFFSGRKDLFDGLAISNPELDVKWESYPVVKIDFSANTYESTEVLMQTINEILSEYEEKYGIKTEKELNAGIRLHNIITEAVKKTGKQAVVLIDEYDKPIIDALYQPNAENHRQFLRSLYSPLKELDSKLKFVFLTGITKVSYVNIFSGLNQLNDISLSEKFSNICGITESELKSNFKPEIKALAGKCGISQRECIGKLKANYDGYAFSADTKSKVYNPFCLLQAFFNSSFDSYWVKSGTATLLVKTLANSSFNLDKMLWEGRNVDSLFFSDFNPENRDVAPLLYQTGYLTIKDYNKHTGLYRIGFPNREVENALLSYIIPHYVSRKVNDNNIGITIEEIRDSLLAENTEKTMKILTACVADIPTILQVENCENYYETVVHVLLRLTGYEVVSEWQKGRSDCVIKTPYSIYIFELKMDNGTTNLDKIYEEAFKQIEDKKYAARFTAADVPVHKVAVVFSSEKKGLVGWKEI